MTKFTHITIDGIAYIVSDERPNENDRYVIYEDCVREQFPEPHESDLKIVAQSSPVHDGLKLFRLRVDDATLNEMEALTRIKYSRDVAINQGYTDGIIVGFTEGRKGMFAREEMIAAHIAGQNFAFDNDLPDSEEHIQSLSTFPVELVEENEVMVFRRKA